jgi:protein dithiol:quinone oxidoreductase
MSIFTGLASLPAKTSAWALLFLSALALESCALYFQYEMDLRPCIMCIYQRTAIFGIMFAALLPLINNNVLARLLAYVVWAVSAVRGLQIAMEHVEIQTSANSFFATCEIVPNFPSWLPLHELLPAIFAATGDCGDINWSFMNMSMPQWMVVVFAFYGALLALLLVCRMWKFKTI